MDDEIPSMVSTFEDLDTTDKKAIILSEKTTLDPGEIYEAVREKVDEYSGLVNESGAIDLVAKDHDINMERELRKERSSSTNERDGLDIENIVGGMSNIEVVGTVVDISDIRTFDRDDGNEGAVRNIVIDDGSGKTQVTTWDEHTELGDHIDVGDRIRIRNAHTKHNDYVSSRYDADAEIRINDSTRVTDDDSGDTIMAPKA